ncbi:MAG TPA: phage tail protein [Kofleriaceae bacterium]|nr:phage tail protein [Kofleriaceae bacterium]
MTNQPSNTAPRAYAAAHFALELDNMKNIGVFRSIEGGGIKADVMTYQNGGTYDRWRQLGKAKFEDLKLQLGMAMSEPFYNWIAEFFLGHAVRKDGAIIAADFYYKERARRKFTNAMIKELTIPKLDGQDKNAAYMTVAIAVEDIVFIKGEGTEIAVDSGGSQQKAWKACNFVFTLGAFDCKRVTKIESFTVKQNILEYASGGNRWMSKTPSAMDYPQVSFSLPEADAQPIFDHFMKRGVKGEVPGRLQGSIEMFDNEHTTTFTVELDNCDILNVQPDKADATTEEIKQVKVDLYVEAMKFTYKGND